jgi:hypothetical protein
LACAPSGAARMAVVRKASASTQRLGVRVCIELPEEGEGAPPPWTEARRGGGEFSAPAALCRMASGRPSFKVSGHIGI